MQKKDFASTHSAPLRSSTYHSGLFSIDGLPPRKLFLSLNPIQLTSNHSTPLLQDWLGDDVAKRQRREVHFPTGRFGEAIEQAQAVLFLASDESSFVNGTDFVVDGGMSRVSFYIHFPFVFFRFLAAWNTTLKKQKKLVFANMIIYAGRRLMSRLKAPLRRHLQTLRDEI